MTEPAVPPRSAVPTSSKEPRRSLAPRLRRLGTDPRTLGPLAVVVVVLVTVIVGGSARSPRTRTATASTVALTSSTLVCPQVGGADARVGGASRVGYAASDIGDPTTGDVQPVDTATTLTSTPLSGTDPALSVAIQPGHAWVVDGGAAAIPLRQDITGPAATDVGVTEFDRTVVGEEPQLAATSCDGPTTDAWFAGFSSQAGDTAELLLTDVDTVPAVVDVEMWNDSSDPDTTSTDGITVQPGTQVAVHLDERNPGLSNLVAHVVATQGRVVPALLATTMNGSIGTGADWVPITDGPAMTQTVPGIAGGPGDRDLIVADVGDLDATVSVQLVTPDSSYTPTSMANINVSAGRTTVIALDGELQGDPAAAVITSTAPVVVGGSSTREPDVNGATDFALTPATPALSGPTLVSGTELSVTRHTVLLLSAPGDDAHLTLTQLPYTASTPTSTQQLTVPGGTTEQVDLATLGADDPGPGILVTPTSGGPLYGSWLITEAGLTPAGGTEAAGDIAEVPMRTPLRSRVQPPVQQRLTAGLP
jgi:hypothetical protein